MEFVAPQSEKRTDRIHKLSFGHVEATIHKAEQLRTSAGTRAPVRISLYCDQTQDIAIKLRTLSYPPQQLAGAAQGDCARRGAGCGAVQSRYRPLCDISANHRGRCPRFRIEPSTATARNAAEIEGAIAAIAREPGGGVVQIPDSFTLLSRSSASSPITACPRCIRTIPTNRSGHQPQGALGLAVPSPSLPKDLCGSPQARSSPTDRSSILTLSCDRLPTVPLESERDLQCQYASSSRRIIRLGQTRSQPCLWIGKIRSRSPPSPN
jgi:hypothetical protein